MFFLGDLVSRFLSSLFLHIHGNVHHFSQVWIQLFFEQIGTSQAMVKNTQTLQNRPNEEEGRDVETTFPFWQIHMYWNVFSVWILVPWQLFIQPFWKYFLIHLRLSYFTSYKRMLLQLFLFLPFTRKRRWVKSMSKIRWVKSVLPLVACSFLFLPTYMRNWRAYCYWYMLIHWELVSSSFNIEFLSAYEYCI